MRRFVSLRSLNDRGVRRFVSLRSLNVRGVSVVERGSAATETKRLWMTGMRHPRHPYPRRMPHAYMLRCADGTLYVGSTLDLARRLAQHQAGEGAAYTRRRRPVELFWSSECARIDEAFAWEKRLQGWSHAKRLAFAEGGVDAVRGWSAAHRRRD